MLLLVVKSCAMLRGAILIQILTFDCCAITSRFTHILLVVALLMASSNSEARKLIVNHGLKLNDVTVSDPKLVVGNDNVASGGVVKLSSGRKKHVLVKPL